MAWAETEPQQFLLQALDAEAAPPDLPCECTLQRPAGGKHGWMKADPSAPTFSHDQLFGAEWPFMSWLDPALTETGGDEGLPAFFAFNHQLGQCRVDIPPPPDRHPPPVAELPAAPQQPEAAPGSSRQLPAAHTVQNCEGSEAQVMEAHTSDDPTITRLRYVGGWKGNSHLAEGFLPKLRAPSDLRSEVNSHFPDTPRGPRGRALPSEGRAAADRRGSRRTQHDKVGRRNVVTCEGYNASCWNNARRHLEGASSAIQGYQEHRLPALRCTEVRAQLSKTGYESHFSAAWAMDKGAWAGGVALVWGPWLRVVDEPIELVPGRAVAAAFRFSGLGTIWFVSIYLRTGQDLDINSDYLQQIFLFVIASGRRFVIFGDWNLQPEVLAGWLSEHRIRAAVRAPPQPACFQNRERPSTLDYAVMSDDLAEASAAQPEVQYQFHGPPHYPVSHRWYLSIGDLSVSKLCREAKASPVPAFGPHLPEKEEVWRSLQDDLNSYCLEHCGGEWQPPLCEQGEQHQVSIDAFARRWNRLPYREAAPKFGFDRLPGRAMAVKEVPLRKALKSRLRPVQVQATTTSMIKQRLHELRTPLPAARRMTSWPTLLALVASMEQQIQDQHFLSKAGPSCSVWLESLKDVGKSFQCLWRLDFGGASHGLHELRLNLVLDDLLGLASEDLEKLKTEDRRVADASWRAFAEKAFGGGAGLGHKLTKPVQDIPLQLAHTQDGLSSRPSELLGEQVCKWSRLWREGEHDDTRAIQWPAEQAATPLDPGALRRSAMSFRKDMASPEGWTPRQYAYLGECALWALSRLLVFFEVFGLWPADWASLLTVLLQKPKGGYRPIGLFRSLYRLWGRARAQLISDWAVHAAPPGVFCVLCPAGQDNHRCRLEGGGQGGGGRPPARPSAQP